MSIDIQNIYITNFYIRNTLMLLYVILLTLSLILIIEKLFDIVIKFWNNIKNKLYVKKVKELIFWRIRILILVTLILYLFNIYRILIILVTVIFVILMDGVLLDLNNNFLVIYNLYNNLLFDATSTNKSFIRGYTSVVYNLYNIFVYRTYLKYLYFNDAFQLSDVYKFQIKIDVNYYR